MLVVGYSNYIHREASRDNTREISSSNTVWHPARRDARIASTHHSLSRFQLQIHFFAFSFIFPPFIFHPRPSSPPPDPDTWLRVGLPLRCSAKLNHLLCIRRHFCQAKRRTRLEVRAVTALSLSLVSSPEDSLLPSSPSLPFSSWNPPRLLLPHLPRVHRNVIKSPERTRNDATTRAT